MKITGAILGTRAIDADAVTKLAALPSRETLLAEAIGAITAPMATTAGLFDAPLRDVVGLVQARHQIEQRALTDTRRAHHRAQLPFGNVQIDPAQHRDLRFAETVVLGQTAD